MKLNSSLGRLLWFYLYGTNKKSCINFSSIKKDLHQNWSINPNAFLKLPISKIFFQDFRAANRFQINSEVFMKSFPLKRVCNECGLDSMFMCTVVQFDHT